MDLLRESWQLRCKFIHAETTMTAREMLSHRTLQLYLENKQHTHLLPARDRHLLDKEGKYFRSATKESLELWESNIHEKNQPCIPFAPIVTDRQVVRAHIVIQKYNETDMTARLQVLDNFIGRARQLKRKHKITNADPTWNKRLRLTHTGKIPQKRTIKRQYKRRKRIKLDGGKELTMQMPEITPQLFVSLDNNSE